MKKSIIFLFLIILLAGVSPPLRAQMLRPAGLLSEDLTKNPSFRKANRRATVRALASAVDNSTHLPSVGDQGAQNSCVAWAAAYYYKTYQEWQDYGWSVTDQNHIFSPSFVYNHINGGVDSGSYFSDAMAVLLDHGCAPLSRFPVISNITALPSQSVYRNALQYRSRAAFYIQTNDMTGINDVRQHLAAGNVAILGINIWGNFDAIHSYDNTYCVKNKIGECRGGHALVIVGYDDNKVTADGTGAFRLVNSWGSSFGDNGFLWMSYQAVMDPNLSQQCVWYTSDRMHYAPSIIASLGISHPDMKSLEVTVGIGPLTSPRYSKRIFDFYANSQPYRPLRAFPSTLVDIDLSDGLQYLDTAHSTLVYVHTKSMVAGMVNSYSATDLRSTAVTFSGETPMAIPADNVGVYTTMNMTLVPGTTLAATVGLRKGWNMISIPIMMPEMTAAALFAGADSPVYGYFEKYAISTALENGKGYWVRYPNDTTITLSGNRVTRTTIALSAGWNLVGGYDQNISFGLSTTTPPGILLPPCYGMTDKYEIASIMEPGKSYWVRASEAGELNAETIIASKMGSDGTCASSRATSTAAQTIDAEWMKITIRDSRGREAVLYRGRGADQPSDLALPPLPPEGIFDVRWASNRIAESATGTAELLLHSLAYPVSLGVEGEGAHIFSPAAGALINEVLRDKESLTIVNSAIDRLRVDPVEISTSIHEENIPALFELSSIYPNPFNPTGTIRYSLAEDSDVTLSVYDALGRQSAVILSGQEKAGRHSVLFDAHGLPSGAYLYRLTARSSHAFFSDVKRLVVLK